MATDLYRRTINFDYGDQERKELMREVWQGTPWMVDAFTGQCGEDRERSMLHWCYEMFGEQAFPFGPNPKAGHWYRGNATINGWTWFGFSTESQMNQFIAHWPAPEAVAA